MPECARYVSVMEAEITTCLRCFCTGVWPAPSLAVGFDADFIRPWQCHGNHRGPGI